MLNKIKILPSNLKGKIKIPGSKSLTHRYLLGAALSNGKSYIKNVFKSLDILATIEVLKKIGVIFTEKKIDEYTSNYIIKGNGIFKIKTNEIFNCKESASTLRFIIPLLLLTGKNFKISGEESLKSRPLDVYYELFKKKAIFYKTTNNKLPLIIKGKLSEDKFLLKGDVSSQFITGLLYALPLLKKDSIIKITTNLESKAYLKLTLKVLKEFGIEIIVSKNYKSFYIKGSQKYSPNCFEIESDFSQAAFFAVAGIIGKNPIICENLNINSIQGDRIILDIIKSMGGKIEEKNKFLIFHPSKTKGIKIDVSQCPDLLPIIALLASLSLGTTEIIGTKRLKLKESDRLVSTATELKKIGANIKIKKTGLEIKGIKILKGKENLDSWNDHRIAMMLAIASNNISKSFYLSKWKSVNKSYPSFWKDFKKIGGTFYE